MVPLVAEADRKKFREQFFYAEQELAAVKGREKALQEQLLKEVNDSHERLKKQIQSHTELEVLLCLLEPTPIECIHFISCSSSGQSEVQIFVETESMVIGSFHKFPRSPNCG